MCIRDSRRTVPAVGDEHDVAAADLFEGVDRRIIGAVVAQVGHPGLLFTRGASHHRAHRPQLDVVDLLEVGLDARTVLVVLVRRVG